MTEHSGRRQTSKYSLGPKSTSGHSRRSGRSSNNKAWANVPPKRNRKEPICFSPYLYRARDLVERFFNKIKQCRRIATRIWLRAYESTP